MILIKRFATSKLFIFLFVILFIQTLSQNQYCDHQIFCNEKILKVISNSSLFKNDFKQFVDLVLKVPINDALKSFSTDTLTDFIQRNFISSESILQPTNLSDYVEKPTKFTKIKNIELRLFAYDLNKRWNDLARKVNLNFTSTLNSTCVNDCSTFLDIMNGKTIIIPGGRFKQGYYWDSYWIVKGLIASDMLESAENIIRNFLQILKTYGYIPNGFRKYYLDRSQPPFFTLMVKQVTQALLQKGMRTRAEQLQSDSFMLLIQQHNFWQTYKSKSVMIRNENFKVNIYNANTSTPRPESYRQDLNQLANFTDQNQRVRVLRAFSSMAESGWDFSSRWFINPSQKLSTIMDQIVPSDLNALIGINEAYLAKLAEKFKRTDLQQFYLKRLKQRKQYFSLIKTADGLYPDYKPINSTSIYPSDFYPYLLLPENIDITKFYNDIVNPVSSKLKNGEQWDSPNVWAPNNWILHQVLPHLKAFEFAQQWVSTVYCSWKKTGLIYEKYRNDKLGMRGQGGQYQVQTGFGWTNGLVLYYLMLYPEQLMAPDIDKCS